MTEEVLAPETTSHRTLPKNLRAGDLHLFSHEEIRVIPRTRLLTWQDINVSPGGVLFKRGAAIPEAFAYPAHADEWQSWRARSRLLAVGMLLAPLHTIRETVFWVTDSQSFEYFHWMTDALPRLWAVRDRMCDGRILLPQSYRSFPYITETLRAFPDVATAYIDRFTRCQTLKMPTHTAPTGNYNEPILRGLRDRLQAHFASAPDPGFGERIYISRARARRRKIANEHELVATIEPLGFRQVHMEDLSYDQQVAIVMRSRYLISNHGAGLTNMLFMRPGGRILELRRDADTHFNCYFSMASPLGLDYFYQTCPSERPGEETHTADLVVDVSVLRENLQSMLDG